MTSARVDTVLELLLRARVAVETVLPGEHDLTRWTDAAHLQRELDAEKARLDALYWRFTRTARGAPPPVSAYERRFVLEQALFARWLVRVGDGVTVVRIEPITVQNLA